MVTHDLMNEKSTQEESRNERSFAEMIKEDRAERQQDRWSGTFLEYLELVREDPSIPELAHARFHERLIRDGVSNVLDSEDASVQRLFRVLKGGQA